MNILKKALVGIMGLAVFGACAMPLSPAVAQLDVDELSGSELGISEEQDFKVVITDLLKTVLSFMAILAVIMIVVGGIVWMTAGGDEDKTKMAKQIIYSAVIGLIIILFAYSIVAFVAGQFTS